MSDIHNYIAESCALFVFCLFLLPLTAVYVCMYFSTLKTQPACSSLTLHFFLCAMLRSVTQKSTYDTLTDSLAIFGSSVRCFSTELLDVSKVFALLE